MSTAYKTPSHRFRPLAAQRLLARCRDFTWKHLLLANTLTLDTSESGEAVIACADLERNSRLTKQDVLDGLRALETEGFITCQPHGAVLNISWTAKGYLPANVVPLFEDED